MTERLYRRAHPTPVAFFRQNAHVNGPVKGPGRAIATMGIQAIREAIARPRELRTSNCP